LELRLIDVLAEFEDQFARRATSRAHKDLMLPPGFWEWITNPKYSKTAEKLLNQAPSSYLTSYFKTSIRQIREYNHNRVQRLEIVEHKSIMKQLNETGKFVTSFKDWKAFEEFVTHPKVVAYRDKRQREKGGGTSFGTGWSRSLSF
jgi:hypothetical protein